MKFKKLCVFRIVAVALGVIASFCSPSAVFAADHRDGPILVQDLGTDINDVFVFLDPTDLTQTVLIATTNGFQIPGEVSSTAEFDANVRFRFEIFTDHVNAESPVLDPEASDAEKSRFLKTVKPNKLIDVTFSKRQVGPGQQTVPGGGLIPTNLREPLPQEATITFTGFTGMDGKVFKTNGSGDPLTVSPFNLSPVAPAFVIHDIRPSPFASIRFFAGQADDPFFFDVPAFSSFLDGIRNGGSPNISAFNRQRDTFAGYNTLAIALRIPTSLLQGSGPFIGVDFLTQRHLKQILTNKGVKGGGEFKTVDRMGNPSVNVALIPFDKKNEYNAASPKADAQLRFAGLITETLNELGLVSSPPEASFVTLANLTLAYGDILRLDTRISNLGTPVGAGYPNGRRLQDDTVDYVLTAINHGATLGDGVNTGGGVSSSFPFLRAPNQPLATGSGADDGTRN